MNSYKNKEEESKLDFIKSFTNNSLIETKKKIKTNNKNLFLKIAKRELFKMPFNKTNSLSKTIEIHQINQRFIIQIHRLMIITLK